MWETVDPDGRAVRLTQERWLHIIERHRELGVEPDVLMRAVARPDGRTRGRETGEEWFYRRGAGPSLWIRVVVHYEQSRGLIVTVPSEVVSVSVEIGGIEFDNVLYDREVDVLYLQVGKQLAAADFDASPEGHYLRYDEDGGLFGVTIVNARWLLEQDGKIVITLPDRRRLETSDLGDALAAA